MRSPAATMRGAPATDVLETLERAAGDGVAPASADRAVRSVCVLLNRSAGSIEGDQGSSVGDRLTDAFRKFDVSMNLELVDGDGLEASALRAVAAAQRGAIDAIVVGGGDGSVRAVAGAVAGTDIPVGILPLGTLNHFARDLGLPLDLEQAVATIASGISRRVDLGEVNGHVFINNSSVGIYPYMVLDRERRRDRSGLPKWTAMTFALIRALWRFPRRRLTVHAQDSVAAYRTPCLFVGNNRYDLNFLSVGRRETLAAGRLHIYVARSSTKLGFLWFLLRAALGITDRVNDLDELRVTAAKITSRASRLPVALDGEVAILTTPLRYRTRPRDLRVLLPQSPE